jgi:hypothetical protein
MHFTDPIALIFFKHGWKIIFYRLRSDWRSDIDEIDSYVWRSLSQKISLLDKPNLFVIKHEYLGAVASAEWPKRVNKAKVTMNIDKDRLIFTRNFVGKGLCTLEPDPGLLEIRCRLGGEIPAVSYESQKSWESRSQL